MRETNLDNGEIRSVLASLFLIIFFGGTLIMFNNLSGIAILTSLSLILLGVSNIIGIFTFEYTE